MRRFLFALSTMLAVPSAHATLFKYRVLNRNSVLCATLLTSTRALSTADSVTEGTRAFREFRERILESAPVLTDGPVPAVRARSDRPSEKLREGLVRRAYSVERSFTKPARNDEFVIATATFDARDFDRLLQTVSAARTAVLAEANRADNGIFSWDGVVRYVANLNNYYFYASFIAYKAMSISFMGTLASAAWLSHDPFHPRAIGAYGFTLLLAGVGSFDYPLRHIRSHQLGFQKLAKTLEKFREDSAEWIYWSRDVVVSPEFAQELLTSPKVKWETTLRDEDFREQASGVYRLMRDRRRRRENRNYVNFSIDVLARKVDGAPEMTIVLRSQPVMAPKTATQTKTVADFANASAR